MELYVAVWTPNIVIKINYNNLTIFTTADFQRPIEAHENQKQGTCLIFREAYLGLYIETRAHLFPIFSSSFLYLIKEMKFCKLRLYVVNCVAILVLKICLKD